MILKFSRRYEIIIQNCGDIRHVSKAANYTELIGIVHNRSWDVVVTDIRMQPMNGIEATRYTTNILPRVKVTVLAMFNEISDGVDIVEACAQVYLLKEIDTSEVIEANLQVPVGHSYFCEITLKKRCKNIPARAIIPRWRH